MIQYTAEYRAIHAQTKNSAKIILFPENAENALSYLSMQSVSDIQQKPEIQNRYRERVHFPG